MTLQKIGEAYVNPEEISHISCEVREILGKQETRYGVWMKSGSVFSVSKKEFTEFRDRYFKYTEPDYCEDERDA